MGFCLCDKNSIKGISMMVGKFMDEIDCLGMEG